MSSSQQRNSFARRLRDDGDHLLNPGGDDDNSNNNNNNYSNNSAWPNCNSLGAREAMEAITQSLTIEKMVPGPFVVMQGMSGDGMANTIDSIPTLIVSESAHNYGDNHGDNHVAVLDDETSGNSCLSIPSDLPNEIPHLSNRSSVKSDSNINSNSNSNNSSYTSPSLGDSLESHGTNDHGTHTSDDDLVCLEGSIMASPSSEIKTPRVSNVVSNQTFQSRTQMDRGLHLPLPASAVNVAAMGMGYNNMFSPITSSSGRSLLNNKNERKALLVAKPTSVLSKDNDDDNNNDCNNDNQQQRQTSMNLSDSFILIDDNGNSDNTSHNNSDNNININTDNNSTNKNSTDNNNNNNNKNNNNNNININLTEKTDASTALQGNDEASSMQTQSSNIDIGRYTSLNSNPRYATISTTDRKAIQQWNLACREEENLNRKEMMDNLSTITRDGFNKININNSRQWWITKNGCLALFDTLPVLYGAFDCTSEGIANANSETIVPTKNGNYLRLKVGGEIPPGATVMATEIHYICDGGIGIGMQSNNYKLLKIESPTTGFIVYSCDGYCCLGPGLPSSYIEPEVWAWRVMCPNGAYVRQGVELGSVHRETVSYGSVVRVVQKKINDMGLCRLRIECALSSGLGHKKNNSIRVSGWISESLNPLSGQRGKIVQPIPFPVPALYRVTLGNGAVIRSGVELSSPQIGQAPCGSILTIVGRAFSEHPADRCLERLKLAGFGGWISVRLNKTPPRDYLVVELIGIDGSFDPNEAGLYHINKQRQVIQEWQNTTTDSDIQNMDNLSRDFQRLSSTVSTINDDDDGDLENLESSGEISNTCSSLATAVPTLYRSGVAAGSVGSNSIKACGSKSQKDEHCLICLTENRTATIVHGETGHIACCLACARILKGRGDKVS